MITWENDKELFQIMKDELYTAVLGDIMDNMGYINQFLRPEVKPIQRDMVVVGRAMTILEADTDKGMPEGYEELKNKPFGLMLEALDDIKENEVYICSGASPSYALVGELMSTRMQILGAAGAVMNGYHRDTRGIEALNFPCFSYGAYAQDQAPRGKVIDYRVEIDIDGVIVQPGDLVFGDLEGVLIIPQEIEEEVIKKAYEKATGEKMVAEAIRGGLGAVESYAKHGIM